MVQWSTHVVNMVRYVNLAKFIGFSALYPEEEVIHVPVYSPPSVDRIWGIWGSYYNKPKAMFYLLKGDYKLPSLGHCM